MSPLPDAADGGAGGQRRTGGDGRIDWLIRGADAAVVDGDYPAVHDPSGEGDHTIGGGSDDVAGGRREVDAPVTRLPWPRRRVEFRHHVHSRHG